MIDYIIVACYRYIYIYIWCADVIWALRWLFLGINFPGGELYIGFFGVEGRFYGVLWMKLEGFKTISWPLVGLMLFSKSWIGEGWVLVILGFKIVIFD